VAADAAPEFSRRSGASLEERTTRCRFREFVVASANVFRRREICFVAGARSPAWLPVEPVSTTFRNLAQGWRCPFGTDWL